MRRAALATSALMLCLAATAAEAQSTLGETLNRCATVTDNVERLACYDRAADRPIGPAPVSPPGTVAAPNPAQSNVTSATPAPSSNPAPARYARLAGPAPTPTYLERMWELTPQTRGNNFELTPYQRIYLQPVHWTSNINERPSSPTRGSELQYDGKLKSTEMKYQISFKSRLASDLLFENGDLWFAYTQTSFLQSYAKGISSPFRESDYEPEVMLNFRTDFNVLGLQARMIQLGVVHDSNGRGKPESRSWNRVYLRAGFERGDFAMYVRPWWRITENHDDDNPDIQDYAGRIDLVGIWRLGRGDFTLTARSAMRVSAGRGSLEAVYTHPIFTDPKRDNLRFYLSAFTGYAESLIDYNHKQSSVGAGITVGTW
ncbi:phospholipase A [soil metagenome]